MIESIHVRDLDEIYKRMPFPYDAYTQWQDNEQEPPDQFFATASNTAKIRDRKEWNTFGREIYDVFENDRHASIVSKIIGDFKLTDFLVQQTMPSRPWFSTNSRNLKGITDDMRAYLKTRRVSVNFSTWCGAFIVRDELEDFLKRFLQYPLLLNTYDLELYSLQTPLMMELSHHLSIIYHSPDSAIVEGLKSRIISEGILEYPDRGLPSV